MSRATLSLPSKREPESTGSAQVGPALNAEQVIAYLRERGLVVVPADNGELFMPGTMKDAPSTFDWKYDAPVVSSKPDVSNIPPVGARASIPVQAPPKQWGNPNLLPAEPRTTPGPQPAFANPRGR